MPDPAETDCEYCYKNCKAKCFDNLFESLLQSGDYAQKQAEARERYRTCLKFCKAAKAICDAEAV